MRLASRELLMSILSFLAGSNEVMPYRLNFSVPSLHHRVQEETLFFCQLQQELRQSKRNAVLHSYELADALWNMAFTFHSIFGVEHKDLIRTASSELYVFIQKTPLLRAMWFAQSDGMWPFFIVNVVED